MKLTSARLGTDTPHLLHGSAIDRSRPLQFGLDGRVITGFVGDTVLSAVLACGIDTVGKRDKMAMALTTRHAPAIAPAAYATDPRQALAMERTPATAGAAYVTLGPRLKRDISSRLLRRDRNSLVLDLDAPDALTRPWLGLPAAEEPAADLLIIGGGVAGMSAAWSGAGRGLRVVLVEATPRLGGHARLFGRMDGEETPDQAIDRLGKAIAASTGITVLTSAEAFALRPGMARLHHVQVLDGRPTSRVLDIRARHIVVATGAVERLPVFSGNRLPGVMGALEAFELAHYYGVWPGKSAIMATSNSPAYRLAMLARDAGVDVSRILDSRPSPQSRFIEFSRAYGIVQAAGSVAAAAAPREKGLGLAIVPQRAMDSPASPHAPLTADRLIASGGWQPDLTLWHMAGGESRWNVDAARLDHGTSPPGIALAGSAAGWHGNGACIASGSHAVDIMLGGETKPVDDRRIDPLYETPDGPAPIGNPPDDGRYPAFLDSGRGYLARPRVVPSRWPSWLPFVPKPADWSLADTPQPLDIAEVAAGAQLGAIPSASAGIVAQERVAMVGMQTDDAEAAESGPPALPPAYLLGRHAGAQLFVVTPVEQRQLIVGTLVYAGPDESDPLKAIGTVVRIVQGVAIALVAGTSGQSASVREPGRAITIRLVVPYSEGMDLSAALGGGASPL